MVSGILLDAAEYWLTWYKPIGILVVDIIARLLMIENPQYSSPASSDNADETTTLLPSETQIETHHASSAFGFWSFLYRDSNRNRTGVGPVEVTGNSWSIFDLEYDRFDSTLS